MLDNLTQRLARAMKTIRGEARLTESNITDALREVRMALLEADVALPVVKDFIARVKEKALGEEVIGSLTPGQALVGVVHRELTALMGGADLCEAKPDTIRAIVEAVTDAVDLPEEDAAPEEGIPYERFCAGRLERGGWRTHPTPASGDQGADIVAEQGATRLVVQCKRYRRPVGNAAVQEAAAAARYWSGDMAAVVSNAGFAAARKLAAATGVLLLVAGPVPRRIAPDPSRSLRAGVTPLSSPVCGGGKNAPCSALAGC